jgi:hypothetical protein
MVRSFGSMRRHQIAACDIFRDVNEDVLVRFELPLALGDLELEFVGVDCAFVRVGVT